MRVRAFCQREWESWDPENPSIRDALSSIEPFPLDSRVARWGRAIRYGYLSAEDPRLEAKRIDQASLAAVHTDKLNPQVSVEMGGVVYVLWHVIAR